MKPWVHLDQVHPITHHPSHQLLPTGLKKAGVCVPAQKVAKRASSPPEIPTSVNVHISHVVTFYL